MGSEVRVPVSLIFDTDTDFYNNFIYAMRENRTLSDFIINLLKAYYGGSIAPVKEDTNSTGYLERIPVSLKFDKDSDFYNDFISGMREDRTLSDIIVKLLKAHHEGTSTVLSSNEPIHGGE